MFNTTRHLALSRIIAHAKQNKANAVLGIKTTIMPFGDSNEMLMIGTASSHPSLPNDHSEEVITSDMTNIELWNMANLGYYPLRLVFGTSVYSLGLIGGIKSSIKSFVRGELNDLTRMIYEARENSLDIIRREAESIGADDIIGVNTYVYELEGGLIEMLAIGTAVKKHPTITTESEQLPTQAIVVDENTFYKAPTENIVNHSQTNGGSWVGFIPFVLVGLVIFSIGAYKTFINIFS